MVKRSVKVDVCEQGVGSTKDQQMAMGATSCGAAVGDCTVDVDDLDVYHPLRYGQDIKLVRAIMPPGSAHGLDGSFGQARGQVACGHGGLQKGVEHWTQPGTAITLDSCKHAFQVI